MSSVAGVLGILIVFGAIIFFHELGHFIVAKLSRMAVYEFSLGFGPALISKTYKDTLYAIRIVPLGGFVRIAGMEPDEDPNTPDGFNTKPFIAKFATLIAGVFMNFVLALVIIVILGMVIGEPAPGKKTMVAGVMMNTPAYKQGMLPGDIIAAVDNEKYPTVDRARTLIRATPKTVHLTVERDGKQIPLAINKTTLDSPQRHGLIYRITKYQGIGVEFVSTSGAWRHLGFGESIVSGFEQVTYRIVDAFAQFISMVTGNVPLRMVGGPVMIMHASYSASQGAFTSVEGFARLLSFIALISVLVGFFNLLPIPALDGSRLFFVVVDGILGLFGKHIDPQKEAMVHMVGMIILLSLVALITIKDIYFWVKPT